MALRGVAWVFFTNTCSTSSRCPGIAAAQCAVLIVHAALAHAQHPAQQGGGRVVVQHAVGGELGGQLEHARHQHRLQQRLQLLRGRTEPQRRTRTARRAEHRSDMTMWQWALVGKSRGARLHGHAAFEHDAKVLDWL